MLQVSLNYGTNPVPQIPVPALFNTTVGGQMQLLSIMKYDWTEVCQQYTTHNDFEGLLPK